MKKLKEWLEKRLKSMADDDQFSAGNKWGHECVLAKIKKMEYEKQENALKLPEKFAISFAKSFDKAMNEYEMYKTSFKRPTNFFELSYEKQWKIDKDLGILDWNGSDLTKLEMKRFREHYKIEN